MDNSKDIIKESQKENRKAYDKKYYWDHREECLAASKVYRQTHKEKFQEYEKQYYKENKEKKIARGKKYYWENKPKCQQKAIEYREEHYEELCENKRNYYYTHDGREKARAGLWKLKKPIFDTLGYSCAFCEEKNVNVLTIDHKNNDGAKDRRGRDCNAPFRDLRDAGYPEDKIKEKYQILCCNCNFSKNRRVYLDLPEEQLNRFQKRFKTLWKKAFEFFGPCPCGCDNLKFLSIDHKNNNGAEKRRNGEKKGVALLVKFNQLDWPESLKEEYQLSCFNCNCGEKDVSKYLFVTGDS